MARPKTPRHIKAFNEAKKALKWIVLSGAALTILNTLLQLLEALQSGTIDVMGLVTGLGYAIAFGLTNTLIYYLHEYQKAE